MGEITGFLVSYEYSYDYCNHILEKMIFPLSCYYVTSQVQKYRSTSGSNFFCAIVNKNINNNVFFYNYKDLVLLLEGEIYNNQASPHHILEMFQLKGNFKFLADYDGTFRLIIYDKQRKKLYLVTDLFGLRPLYFYENNGNLFFSSKITSLIKSPFVSKEIDIQSLAYILSFGFILGNKTFFKNIHLIPQSSVLEYDLNKSHISIKKYENILSLFTEKDGHKHIHYEEIAEIFKISVHNCFKNREKVGISLSGGLDSRCILSILANSDIDTFSYTVGIKGCGDEIIASKIARTVGIKHSFIVIDQRKLTDLLSIVSEISYFSDGFYFSNELTEKFVLDYLTTVSYDILFRGHGGELVKSSLTYPVPGNKKIQNIKSLSELIEYIVNPLHTILGDLEPKIIFQDKFRGYIKDSVRLYLKENLKNAFDKLHPVDVILYFFLTEYVQRKVVASLDIFRSKVEICNPFLNKTFLSTTLRLPFQSRYNGQVQKKIIKKYMPELMKIPDVNTGAPLNASPLRVFITDKFNSLMKKLSVPGFRHYTEFERWQREYFKESIKQILFDKRTLDRGLYLRKGLEEIFNEHITGKRNYARLLGTIVGLELWFRNFVD